MLTPEQAVDVANEVFGSHAGCRALHAKGTRCKGTFTATPAGARLCRAGHMSGDAIPLVARLSNGSGHPGAADGVPDVRGLALNIVLPDGTTTDIVAQSAPKFPSRTPEEFLRLLRAGKPSAASLIRLPAFLARNPRAILGLPGNLAALRPPASYAVVVYYAVHAFKWIDAEGGERYVRYTLRPEASGGQPSALEARRRDPDYLQDELRERLAGGPVRWRLEVQVAGPGDDPDDPSSVWPADRDVVHAGTIELTGLDTERETGGDVLVFDPTRIVDGIELSADPVLLFRPHAYSVSVERRTST